MPSKLRYWVKLRASLTNMIGMGGNSPDLYVNHTYRMSTTPSVPIAVGIDVAKATLSVCVRYHDGSERALSLRNIDTDINRTLLPYVRECTGKVVLESTGHYHWPVTLILTDNGLPVHVVNPILAKQYTSGNVRKVKTDPADAQGLARMALVADNLPPAFSLDRNTLHLRKTLAMLGSMQHQLQALQASLKSLEEAEGMLEVSRTPAVEAIRDSVTTLRSALRKAEHECVRLAQEDETLRTQCTLLTSIPGVSDFCATLSLAWFKLAETANARSWVAYAGLDISSRESGTWNGKCKLTKRGNSYLRRRLYCSAWGAVMNDLDFKMYYEVLRKEYRKAHTEALVIIARKLVRTMYTVLETGRPYDSAHFSHHHRLSTVAHA